MGSRLDLQQLLEDTLGSGNVYFQPPPSVLMNYPCIVYERSNIDSKYANNGVYHLVDRYQVTVIDANPDSDIPHKVGALPGCSYDRHFMADNLNHDVFRLYF